MAKRAPGDMDVDDRGAKMSAKDSHHYQCPACKRQLTGSHKWVLVTGSETGEGWRYVCRECMDQAIKDRMEQVAKDAKDAKDDKDNNGNDDKDCEMVG